MNRNTSCFGLHERSLTYRWNMVRDIKLTMQNKCKIRNLKYIQLNTELNWIDFIHQISTYAYGVFFNARLAHLTTKTLNCYRLVWSWYWFLDWKTLAYSVIAISLFVVGPGACGDFSRALFCIYLILQWFSMILLLFIHCLVLIPLWIKGFV